MNPWIAGAVGWVFQGPIGALLGFAAAQIWNRITNANAASASSSPPPSGSTAHNTSGGDRTDGNFAFSLMVLVAAIMQADGHATRDELAVVKQFLRKNTSIEFASSALDLLKQLLKQSVPVPPVCGQIRRNMNIADRRALLHLLYSIAYADGSCHPAEARLLATIASQLGLSASDAQSIAAMFEASDAEADYRILEISSSASDDEVRQAYRRMVKKHHPDTVAHLGPEFQQAAAEKFRAVHTAYERILQRRSK